MAKKASSEPSMDMAIGITPKSGQETITARTAGGLADLDMSISPRSQEPKIALRNLAKAMNIALKTDFIETDLDHVYKAAHVRKGRLRVLHMDYIGLGDGVMASIGKAARSVRLTFQGPDAGSPEGQAHFEKHGNAPVSGLFNLLGRKLNLLQEYEDKVPFFVEQTLDRLEAKRVIRDWHRNEWKIETTLIGLDIFMTPLLEDEDG